MVVVAPLAVDLLVILACLVALGILLSAKALADALVSIVRKVAGRLPLIGRLFDAGALWVEQRIVEKLSEAVNGVEGIMGQFWHALGNLVTSIGHEIFGLAVALESLAGYVRGVVVPYVLHALTEGLQHGVKWLRHELAQTKTQVFRVTRIIEHPTHTRIGGAVRAITAPLAAGLAGLERWTIPRVKWLGHEVAVELPRDIAGLRARDQALARAYERLRKWVVRHDRLLGAGALTAAVAFALARLGGGWIRCRNWNRIGRAGCRLPAGLIEELLGVGIDALVLADLCEIVTLTERAAGAFVPVLEQMVAVDALVCRAGGASLPSAV